MSANIVAENLTKQYHLSKHRTFKEFLPALFSGQKIINNFKALSSLNFSIDRGSSLGILGKNGSGKSTLLKIIAGVTKPSDGRITVKGKVAPLIELGAGFHPELTGKENVYLNGSILGIKKKQMDLYYKDIVAFAELEAFMDQPVKYYSSGMYMRLAFSVAVAEQPDILLVDEILAVGDLRFQQKCLEPPLFLSLTVPIKSKDTVGECLFSTREIKSISVPSKKASSSTNNPSNPHPVNPLTR